MDKPEEPSERRAESAPVIELPEGKTERIASMRHELLDLQRHLLEAQQRITSELAGRAEDADRLEALELRVKEHEVKADERAAQVAELTKTNESLRSELDGGGNTAAELRRELEARDARIEQANTKNRELAEELARRDAASASTDSEREAHEATKTRLEGELEAAHAKHRDVSEQLDALAASLTEAKAVLVIRDAELSARSTELSARTAERDALQSTATRLEAELEESRRALETGRGKALELAKQLTGFSQEMLDTVVVTDPRGPSSSRSGITRLPATPPPIPPSRASRPMPAVEPEAIIVEASAPPASPARWLLLVLGGVAVGVALTAVVVKLTGNKTTEGNALPEAARPPPSASVVDDWHPAAAPADAGARISIASDASMATAALPSDASGLGVIVLTPEADGHRVFVDGHRVEPKNGRVEVPCGPHEVQIGSKGDRHTLDVACDGPTELH